MCVPVNFLKFSWAIFLQDICEWPPLNVLLSSVIYMFSNFSQKQAINCKSIGNMCTFLS